MKNSLRGIISVALVGVLVFGLGGCSIFSKFRGQSAEQATEQLRSVEGLAGDVEIAEYLSGFTKNTHGHVSVVVKGGYNISDPDTFAKWLVSLGWSANNTKINSSVVLYISFEDEPVVRDWGGISALQKAGFKTAEGEPGKFFFSVRIDSSDAESNLGPWPGRVPEIPEGMLTRVSE